jgi:hypothetical protein
LRFKTPLAVLATAVLAVGLSSVTTASAAQQTSAAAPTYPYVCVAKNGTMRLATKTTVCGYGEKKQTWNTTKVANKNIGPMGPAGPQGPQGVKGADGKDGAPGAKGADGKDGAPGAKGADGKDGVDGKDGAPGAKGDKGEPGSGAQKPINSITFSTTDLGIPGPHKSITLCNITKSVENPAFGPCK